MEYGFWFFILAFIIALSWAISVVLGNPLLVIKYNAAQKKIKELERKMTFKTEDQILSDERRVNAEKHAYVCIAREKHMGRRLRETTRLAKKFINTCRFYNIHSPSGLNVSAMTANNMEDVDIMGKSSVKIIQHEVNKGLSTRRKRSS